MTPAPPATDTTDAVFGALADATRRSLLRDVVDRGPVTATALAVDRPMSRQAIAKHLGVLARAGLVQTSRQGRELLYVADPGPLAAVVAWVDDTGAAWDRRLARLADLLDG